MNEQNNEYFQLPDKVYKFIKYMTVVFLPAASLAYVGLAAVWGWPLSKEISATISVITVFFAAIFLISDAEYNKSKLQAQKDLEALVAQLQAEKTDVVVRTNDIPVTTMQQYTTNGGCIYDIPDTTSTTIIESEKGDEYVKQ